MAAQPSGGVRCASRVRVSARRLCTCTRNSLGVPGTITAQLTWNGGAPQAKSQKPAPPAEVSGWALDETPPDLLEWARQTFNEEEFSQEVREVEQTGGVKFEDLIGEIEERVKRRD